MDKVQIYCLVLLGFNALGYGAMLAKKPGEGLFALILGIVFALPIYGRIFGWW